MLFIFTNGMIWMLPTMSPMLLYVVIMDSLITLGLKF